MTQFCGFIPRHRFFLAPMAGITDWAFRTVCAEWGAAVTYTEMVSAKALCYQDQKSKILLETDKTHQPCIVQIFGSQPEVMAEGARKAVAISGAVAVDINMGCPVHKIVSNGEGSALMRNPALAEQVITAVVKAVNLPVTVKFRKGYESDDNTAVEFARMAESAGAAALCVHGRTRSQMYGGISDTQVIAHVKRAVSIPVIASGDALSATACIRILDETGADFIMIARGALGNPLIFRDCLNLYEGRSVADSQAEELYRTMEHHAALTMANKGERHAMTELRKHMLWYLGRLKGGKPYKAQMAAVSAWEDFARIMKQLRDGGLQIKECNHG